MERTVYGWGWSLCTSQGFSCLSAGFARSASLPRADGSRRRAGTRSGDEMDYGEAGLAAAAGLLASAAALGAAAAALAASAGAGAAGAATDAAASGAGAAVSSDLLQAVMRNIETNARNRTLRIAFSLVGRCQLSGET